MQATPAIGKQPQGRPPTIRFQLLVSVNLVLAIFVAVILAFDYRREIADRLDRKHVALEEEAKTLLPAVLLIRSHGRNSVQQYVDAVCGRMQESHSPGHHIAVELQGDAIQAAAHHRASPEILAAMQQAAESPGHRSRLGPSELVVGMYRHADATAYVSETLDNLYQSVVGDVLRRLAGIVGLASIAGLVVNLVLTRIVTRPLGDLVATVQQIGEGKLGAQTSLFRSAELHYLADEINAMSESLAEADRNRQTHMAKAREIQHNLLPREIEFPGLEVAYLFEPADDISGDYYDALPLHDGTWLLCVADVTGHGVPAALTAAIVKVLLVQATEKLTSPAKILDSVNRGLITINPTGDFVTMFLARVLAAERRIEYASAGHEPAWLRTANGSVQALKLTGLILGVVEEAGWDDMVVDVAARDRLLLVTDGVSETFNPQGEMYGRQRVAEEFAENA